MLLDDAADPLASVATLTASLDAWCTRQYDYYQRVVNGALLASGFVFSWCFVVLAHFFTGLAFLFLNRHFVVCKTPACVPMRSADMSSQKDAHCSVL